MARVEKNWNRAGANFELEIMHYLAGCACESTHRTPKHVGWRGFGYDGIRSSGSAGAMDVVMVGSVDTTDDYNRIYSIRPDVLFIQAKINQKRATISPSERRALMGISRRAGALPIVAYRAVDDATGRVRPHFRLLTGLGPKDWVPWEPDSDDE